MAVRWSDISGSITDVEMSYCLVNNGDLPDESIQNEGQAEDRQLLSVQLPRPYVYFRIVPLPS